MDIIYWKGPKGNFGDDLNDWIWDQLLPGWREWDNGTTLIGVGTLLNRRRFPSNRPGRFLVAGTGVGYGKNPDTRDPRRWDIRSLRGPRSALKLGLSPTLGIVDPAIMLSEMDEFRGISRQGKPIFIPHHSSVDRYDWSSSCEQAGIEFVSPCDEAKSVIRRIAMAPLVLAESMHAAIIADTFRTPWIPLSFSRKFNAEKWLDWSDSLELQLDIRPLHPVLTWLDKFYWRVSQAQKYFPAQKKRPDNTLIQKPSPIPQFEIAKKLFPKALRAVAQRRPCLSADDVLRRQKERYHAVLNTITQDYGSR